MRYTKNHVIGMFQRLSKAICKRTDAEDWKPLYLDHNGIYGGYVIEQQEESGGISHPFGSMRRSAKEMYYSMHMATQALENLGER